MDFELAELKEASVGRVSGYGLLARLYHREIDEAFLDEMCQMRFPKEVGNTKIDTAYQMLRAYLSKRWERTLSELSVDYTRVFFGDGLNGMAAAYPMESIYTSGERLMMQGARDEVIVIYKSEGLGKDTSWKEYEDHIAVELEFMQIMAQKSLAALEASDLKEFARTLETQKNFLENHLLNWVPQFSKAMQLFAKTDLYLALALLTEGFLELDQELLDDIQQALACTPA